MALSYLLDPTNQFQNIAGVNNVHGFFKVYLADTDDLAVTYKDFSGTLNPERIDIDNNGRVVVIADSSRPYRVEMYEPNGALVFTQQPVWTLSTGGGVTPVSVESTDGSLTVDKVSSGGAVTYDIAVNRSDDPAFLDWVKCSWYDLVDGKYVPRYSEGTMEVGTSGLKLAAGMLYHVTATVRANKASASPWYDNVGLHFNLFDGENSVVAENFTRNVDRSILLSEDFTIDADIKAGSVPCQLYVTADGLGEGVTLDLVTLEAHRVYSGVPMIPGGVATESWVESNYQGKLVAGEGITIDPDTNTISSDAEVNVQADWTESDPDSPSYIQNKPTLAAVATTGAYSDLSGTPTLATVATTGDYGDLSNRPTIPAAQVNSDWNANSGVAQILNKPTLATVATSGSYDDLTDKPDIPAMQEQADWTEQDSSEPSFIKNKPNLSTVATSGSYDDLTDKPSIPAAQVQSNWSESDSSSKAYIQNKPSLAAVATSGSYNDLSDKPSIPTQVQSDWAQSDSTAVDFIKNKPNLAAVATSGDYDDLSNKPTIPVVPQMKDLVEGMNIHITETAQGIEISAVGGTQVQSDWTEQDSSAVDYIKNKPTLATVATSGSYTDLTDRPSIPAAQVQSDWTQSDNTAVDYIKNKPSLATVATSGSYTDLTDKPSIPAAQVQSDWSQSDNTAVDYIKNKPSLATVATTGSYSDLSNTPTINNVPAVTSGDDGKVLKASYAGGVGSYSWVTESGGTVTDVEVDGVSVVSGGVANITMPTELVPAVTSGDDGKVLKATYSGGVGTYSWETESGGTQVQADWTEQDSSDPSYIQNKPTQKTITAGTGIAITESQNSLSVYTDPNVIPTKTEMNTALAGKQGTLTAGANITIDANNEISAAGTTYTAGANITISANNEISATDTTYTAGEGVKISNQNVISADETVLWSGTKSWWSDTSDLQLSEAASHFKAIRVKAKDDWELPNTFIVFPGDNATFDVSLTGYEGGALAIKTSKFSVSGSTISLSQKIMWQVDSNKTVDVNTTASFIEFSEIVGINRIANN